MSNLLPQERLQSLRRRFYYRLLLVGSLVLLLTAVFAALAVLPSYVAPKIARGLQGERALATSTAGINLQSRTETNEILRSQAILAKISPIISATSSASDLLIAVILLRPEGISIDHLIFTSGRDGIIIVEGVASGREEINLYREELAKQSDKFTGVSVPVGSLLGKDGGEFTITLKGAF